MATEREVIKHCLCNKVRTAARSLTTAYDDALRPVGLRATQLAVLAAVGIDGSASITAIAQLLGMDRSTLSRNLRPLEKDGLVDVGVEGWHRSRTLEITRKGRTLLNRALPLWEKAQETLRRKLGEQDWLKVGTSLDRLLRVE